MRAAIANKTTNIVIIPNGSMPNEVSAKIRAPSGRTSTAPVGVLRDKSLEVECHFKEIGLHQITLLGNGRPLFGQSEVAVDVFDPSLVVLFPTNQIAALSEPLSLIVDTTRASQGEKCHVDVKVIRGGDDVGSEVVEASRGIYQVTFTPTQIAPHTVLVTINGVSEENCSLIIPVIDKSLFKILGEGVSYAAVNQKSTFKVIAPKIDRGNLTVNIISMADGSSIVAAAKRAGDTKADGTIYEVEYVTRKIGDYRAEVRCDGATIGEGPFVIKSFDPGKVLVVDLKDGTIGVESRFLVDASGAGEGNMVIAIESASDHNQKCPNRVKVDGSKFKVMFTPRMRGPHAVNILFNDMSVAGSPFLFNVLDHSAISLKGSTEVQRSVQVKRDVKFHLDAPNCDLQDFKVEVKGPNGETVPAKLFLSSNDEIEVKFFPTSMGDYNINVTYGGHVVPGFPKLMSAYDIGQVVVGEIKPGHLNRPATFEVDTTKAGAGQLEVIVSTPTSRNVPVRVTPSRPGCYMVTFTPSNPGRYKVEVKFNNELVPGGPFSFAAADNSKVKVAGEGLGRVAANKQTSFDVDMASVCEMDVDEKDFEIKIYDPSGRLVNHRLQKSRDVPDAFRVHFTPKEVGRHRIEVKWAGLEAGGGPFVSEVYDASRISVANLPEAVAMLDVVNFDVDTRAAGDGKVEVKVQSPTTTYTGRLSPSSSSSPGVVKASFQPREAGRHMISVLYEDQAVAGSPFVCLVVDPKQYVAKWEAVKNVPVNKRARLEVTSSQPLTSDLISANVIDPNGDRLPLSVLPFNPTSSGAGNEAAIEFVPALVGRHKLQISVLGKHIPGSPFASDVCDILDVDVEGLDVDSVSVKKRVEFFVKTKVPVPGIVQAKVTSRGQSSQEVIVTSRKVGPNVTKFSFTPVDDNNHLINLTVNDELIPGFPKVIRVENPVPEPSTQPVEPSSRPVEPSPRPVEPSPRPVEPFPRPVEPSPRPVEPSTRPVEASSQYEPLWKESSSTQTNPKVDYDRAKVIVTAPNGNQIEGRLIRDQTGEHKIDYVSPYVGRHKVEVVLDGEHIMSTPFHVDVHDVTKVDVVSAKQKWHVNEPVDFEVVTKKAGDAKTSIKVLEPNGTPVPLEVVLTEDGQRVFYTPRSAGPYKAYITFGGESVHGGNPLVQEVVKPSEAVAHGLGLSKGLKEEVSRFFVDSKNQKGDLTVQVDGPNTVAKVNIESVQNGVYNVTYIPVEVGHFDVYLRWNGKNIPGSPFRPKVVDPTKVKAAHGWDRVVDPTTKVMNLQVDQVNKIELDTKMAGPGQLTAEVMSLKSGANVATDVVKVDEDQYLVALVPVHSGDYLIRILWEDFLIPACPITGRARAPDPNDSSNNQTPHSDYNELSPDKVVVSGRGLREATIGQMGEFIIDGTHGGPGHPRVKLTCRDEEISVQVVSVNKNLYTCSYEPHLPDSYRLDVYWSGMPVGGSPYEVVVSEVSDASKVVCSGEGLKKGTFGQDIRAAIDTRRAGRGFLEVQCVGASSTASTPLHDNKDGTFTLFIKPKELGRHRLEVKYAGKHVTGSPFLLKISPPPNPSKVIVYGPGVRHGLLADFKGHFFVDTGGAGAGQLSVRVRGPRGAFCVEMQKDKQKDRLITCRYDPSERGEYVVQVRWSDVDVPGSPFHVRIVETKEELEEATRSAPLPGRDQPSGSHDDQAPPRPTRSRWFGRDNPQLPDDKAGNSDWM